MKEYPFYQDEKVTMWQRHLFSVMAESQEEAECIICTNRLDTKSVIETADGKHIIFDRTEDLLDTKSRMDADQNEGSDTLAVLSIGEQKRVVCSNEVEAGKKKELWAFVWDCSHMNRDASDEEILKAWEQGPSPSDDEEGDTLYEVEKHTPDELAAQINDNDGAFGQSYVRFIYV